MQHCFPRRLACIGATLLVLASCDRSAVPGDVATRDSAGVAIVESAAPAWKAGEGWRVGAGPAVEIGVEDGEDAYLLSGVTGAVRLGDGRIAVADRGSHEVRFFDSAGRHLLSTGREGSGPGEFGSVSRLELAPGDTLVVYDGMQDRVTLLAPDGRVVRTVAMPTAPGGAPLWYAGRFGDGRLLLKRPAALVPDTRPGLRRDTLTYFRADAAADRADSISALPGSETLVVAQGSGTAGYRRALTADPVVHARGDSLFFSAADDLAVDILGADGRLRRRIRAAVPTREVTAEDRSRFREGMLEKTRGPGRERLREMLAAMPFPARLPAVERLLVDDDGHLWAAEFRRPGDTGAERWTVIDPAGRWLGTVEMPAGFRATHVGDDFVVGVARDEVGVERVRQYDLTR